MRVTETNKVPKELKDSRCILPLREARQRFERAYVDDVMRYCEGDRQLAAQKLNISSSSLKEKLRSGFGGRP